MSCVVARGGVGAMMVLAREFLSPSDRLNITNKDDR